MKRRPDLAERISRRKFTRSVTGSLLAAPLAASLANAQNDNKKDKSQATPSRTITPLPDNRNMHDTPPPLVFTEGSMIVDKHGDFDDVKNVNGRKKHLMKPSVPGQKLVSAHIKVVDGSGEMLYKNLMADDCLITFLLADGIVNAGSELSGGPNNEKHFMIDTDLNKGLVKSSGGDKPNGKTRNTRFRHKDGGGHESAIQAVKITEAGVVLFNIVFTKLISLGDELRVMVWLEQNP